MQYQVVCTQKAITPGTDHTHIVRVGTGSPSAWTRMWTEPELVQAMGQGHTFYTVSPTTGRPARVMAEWCHRCGRFILRSASDAIADNNLNNLPTCLN